MTPAEDLRVQVRLLRDELREARAYLASWHEDRPEAQA